MSESESWRDIRPVVLGVVRRDDELLVAETYDPTDDETFYRPIGGGIEFGEPAEAALRREFREEVGLELEGVEYLETVENIFIFDGTRGHEYVLLFETSLVDETVYEREALTGYEESIDEEFSVVWQSLSTFESGEEIVYPEAVVDVVKESA
ncbi:NUDIX domain-containing protein [Halogranum rubrum]|uniref:NUDIX domain-containing protein n=1 Tax=Halogranum rubrum TaxID=553466 RepID=A0A1I4CBV3_9EURY|nr:NUDIX domain-containing protein [Halogranum rubrum]SFK77759.1 NUDIX domain-containing protein [Halogranum rubrum]